MPATQILVRFPARGLEELEVALADRLTRVATFIAAAYATTEATPLGARVEVAFADATGAPALVIDGVIAWRCRAGALPVGREAGCGVLIDDVRVGGDLFGRAVTRPGAGARVRVPGLRVSTRLNLLAPGDTGIVICRPSIETVSSASAQERTVVVDTGMQSKPPRDDRSDPAQSAIDSVAVSEEGPTFSRQLGDVVPTRSETEVIGSADIDDGLEAPAPAARNDRLELSELTAALDGELDDSLDGDSEDGFPLDRATILARALAMSRDGDGPTLDSERPPGPTPASSGESGALAADLSALDDLSSSDEDKPLFSEPERKASPTVRQALSKPGTERPEVDDLAAFPDAVNEGLSSTARPFEAQSTDVDLLTSVSAGDVVALDLASQSGSFVEPTTSVGEIDLPSVDTAELLDLDQWPAAAGDDLASLATELFSNRPLPAVGGWPRWSDLLDAPTMGVAFTVGKRGLTGVELFAWPTQGSKRYSGVGQGDSSDPRRSSRTSIALADALSFDDLAADGDGDGDVFSAPPSDRPPPPPVLDGADPFSPQGTDPRLNVEGVVAKNVRKSHKDLADDPVVLGDMPDQDPDATRDEMMLPALRRSSIVDPISGTASGEGEASSSSSESE